MQSNNQRPLPLSRQTCRESLRIEPKSVGMHNIRRRTERRFDHGPQTPTIMPGRQHWQSGSFSQETLKLHVLAFVARIAKTRNRDINSRCMQTGGRVVHYGRQTAGRAEQGWGDVKNAHIGEWLSSEWSSGECGRWYVDGDCDECWLSLLTVHRSLSPLRLCGRLSQLTTHHSQLTTHFPRISRYTATVCSATRLARNISARCFAA